MSEAGRILEPVTEAEAKHTAAVALGITKTYDVRVMVTQRGEIINTEYEAVDQADLERMLRRDVMDMEREGDEIAYVSNPLDTYPSDETEIDLREEGEPFSWDACELVKALAKIATNDKALREWADKAKALLKPNQPTET